MLDFHRKHAYYAGMKNKTFVKEAVIKELGGIKPAAEFFGCRRQAISHWPSGKPIPQLRQLQLQLAKPELFPTPDRAA